MEETAAAFESSAISKDHSNSNSNSNSSSSNPSGSSGSVLTDRDDGLADQNGVPSPVRFTRTIPEFPSSSPATTTTATSSSLPKKSNNSTRRLVKKRTVTVPIAEVEGIKGPIGDCTPPPDAWTWRKYGQKPIKGSPYPRGYYRCSSSKGCPARKQVERSRLDPTVLLVTYASEHNHPLPAPRGQGHSHGHGHGHGHYQRAGAGQSGNSRRPATPVEEEEEEKEEAPRAPSPSVVNTGASSPEESTFTDLGDASSFMPMDGGDFCWFSGLVETPLPTTTMSFMDEDDDAGMALPMTCKEVGEDDALFAGLGELPECSVVFRRPSMSSTHGGARGGQPVQLDGYGAVL